MKEEKEEMQDEMTEETALSTIQNFGAINKATSTKAEIFTNITDIKKMFNLNSHVDSLLNDCEGEMIRVKEVLIKRFKKPMKEPVVDEETGEIIKDTETTFSCVLVDDTGKSYATGSKVFTIQLMQYLQMFNRDGEIDPFEIKIVKNKTDKGNKSLGFELI